MAKYSRLFYIRANRSADMTEQIRQITDWKTVEINCKKYQVASIPFKQFFEGCNYRLVVMREEIINETQLPNGGSINRILDKLELCGFIRRYRSYGKKTRDTLFQLIDFYTLFYYNFFEKQKLA